MFHFGSHPVLSSPLTKRCVPSLISFSSLVPGRALCAIIDLTQLYARPRQNIACHYRFRSVLRSPLAEHCVPLTISLSFTLVLGRALCAINDLTQFYARPWQSIVCHYRSHSVLRSPLAEHWVPLSISFGFTLAPCRTLSAIIDLIRFYARPLQNIEYHYWSHSVLRSP